MKVNLKKVKSLQLENSRHTFRAIDHGPGFLRTIEITLATTRNIGEMYHEDARALRDWLNKVLP